LTALPPEKVTLPQLSDDRIPLICREACNLLIAAARPIAKQNLPRREEA
jgi:hypothetical protein